MRTSAGSSPGQSVTCSPPSVAGTWPMMALRLASTMAACSCNRGTVSQCDYLFCARVPGTASGDRPDQAGDLAGLVEAGKVADGGERHQMGAGNCAGVGVPLSGV